MHVRKNVLHAALQQAIAQNVQRSFSTKGFVWMLVRLTSSLMNSWLVLLVLLILWDVSRTLWPTRLLHSHKTINKRHMWHSRDLSLWHWINSPKQCRLTSMERLWRQISFQLLYSIQPVMLWPFWYRRINNLSASSTRQESLKTPNWIKIMKFSRHQLKILLIHNIKPRINPKTSQSWYLWMRTH